MSNTPKPITSDEIAATRTWLRPRRACGRLECADVPTRGLYHEGCDGHFCSHGICQECGASVA